LLAIDSTSALAAGPEAPLIEVLTRSATTVNLRGVLYRNAPAEAGSYRFRHSGQRLV
jgi:hypothetical protein